MLTHIGTKEIKTERVTLRKFRKEDAQAMFETWANDERVTKFLTWEPHGTLEVTEYIIGLWINDYEKEDNYNWAIKFEGKLIGSIGAVHIDERSEFAEIGYCIGYDFWGKGICLKLAKQLLIFFSQRLALTE